MYPIVRIVLLAALHAGVVVAPISKAAAADPPAIDADRAFGYLKDLCKIGPRFSGSAGMEQQQKRLVEHFTELKGRVSLQSFDAPHPLTGQPVRMSNIIVSFHPDAQERVLLCCHYDTRPLPDQDPNPRIARQGPFVGANDGASGVAVLMELAHHLPQLETALGVDFVLFDGEELIFVDRGRFFVGSEHFAKEYRDNPPRHRYVAAVLIDMIGDKNLAIYQEGFSLKYAPELVDSVWSAARRAGVKEFVPRKKHDVRDDHLALNEIARIPAIDLIDFDYPHWHTSRDVPANCSAASLGKVSKVLVTWLKDYRPAPRR